MLETNYRIEFIKSTVRLFLPPTLLAFTILGYVIPFKFTGVNKALFYFVTIAFYVTASVQVKLYKKKRDATKMGAVLPPEVCGRWPRNIDVLLE